MSADDSNFIVAGRKLFPTEDLLSFDISEFPNKNKGKKPFQHQNIIPSKLKRRYCMSKVAELLGLTGKITPIKATMKMDLHNLKKKRS